MKGDFQRTSATIHPLRPSRRSELHLALRVDNYEHLAAAYEADVAESAVGEVQRVLAGIMGSEGVVLPGRQGCFHAIFWGDEARAPDSGPEAGFVEALVAVMAMCPIRHEADVFHVSLSAGAAAGAGHRKAADFDVAAMQAARAALQLQPFCGEPALTTQDWADEYRRDMALAVELFSGLAEERVHLAWQPVCGSGEGDEILYYEGLLRLIDADGDVAMPGCVVPALERLGLVRALDRYMVSRVIEELEESHSVRLAVNVSAQSAICDHWWASVDTALRASVAVARRLVIEITETAAPVSLAKAAAFSAHMRGLGCSIALDDFGVGHASVRQLLALTPDIVKVDSFFVRRAAQANGGPAVLHHLVGLASALARTVVVEGVETEEQSCAISWMGGVWQQGRFFGRASTARPWKLEVPGAGVCSPARLVVRDQQQATLFRGAG
jgi:EAL domain-containing protein (putative c-di-GMP-specific phosphodiesterase class I)